MPQDLECIPSGAFCHTENYTQFLHDQVHEQLNAVLKGDGGIIGITENESALDAG
jgi:hypothetical protein